MSHIFRHSDKYIILVGMFAAFVVGGCAPRNSRPEQVETSNPSVTYEYRGDQELIEANQKALSYCSQYQSAPRTVNISNSTNGKKKVVFDCVARGPVPIQPQPLNPVYTYRSDQELIDTYNNAANYCASQGSQRAVSTLLTNPDGTRVITFRCVP